MAKSKLKPGSEKNAGKLKLSSSSYSQSHIHSHSHLQKLQK